MAAFTTGCDRRDTEHHIVGHVANLSGPGHERGSDALRGVRLAVERLNADSSQWISGKKVAVLHADTKGEPDLFGAQAVRLVTINHVEGLLGGATRAESQSLAPVARDYPVALIGTSGFVGDPPADGAYAVGLTAAEQARAIAQYLGTFDKATRVTVVSAARTAAGAIVTDALQKAGLKFEVVSPDNEQFLTALRRSNGAVVFSAPLSKALEYLKKHDDSTSGNVATLVFAAGAADADQFAKQHPNVTVVWPAAYHTAVQTDAMRAFKDEFREKFGEAPGAEAAASFDAARLLFTAARDVKGFDKAKLTRRLSETKEFSGLTGPLTIGVDQIAHGPAFVLRAQGGKVEVALRLDPPAATK